MFLQEMLKHYLTFVPDIDGKSGLCFHTVRNPQEPVTSGNHHVLNALTHRFFHTLKGNSSEERRLELMLLFGAENFIEACRDHAPGEFNRAPSKKQDQSHDDLIGIATTSWIFGLPYAREILMAGRTWKKIPVKILGVTLKIPMLWYFDNTETSTHFEFSNWLGRFLWFPGFIKAAAGEPLPLRDRLFLTAYFLSGVAETDRTSVSGRQLRYLMTEALNYTGSKMLRWAIHLWAEDQKKTYPEGWNEPMGIYHQPTGGISHPFARFGSLAFDAEFLNNQTHGDVV